MRVAFAVINIVGSSVALVVSIVVFVKTRRIHMRLKKEIDTRSRMV